MNFVTVRAITTAACKRLCTEFFDSEEALCRIDEEDSDPEGMSSDEESDLDRQLCDVNQKMRLAISKLSDILLSPAY